MVGVGGDHRKKSLVMTAPRRGARGQRKFTAKILAPLRGATQLISRIPGGLRGLRPPATFFATLRVAEAFNNIVTFASLGYLVGLDWRSRERRQDS